MSDIDYDFLMQWLWTFAVSHRGGDLIYARRSIRVGDANVTILMHRVILRERMGLEPPTPRHTGDHRDGDSLNNQRSNLRWLTPKQQMANRIRLSRQWAKVAAEATAADNALPF
ncbi:MAG TPA: HNH endonuclease [Xanthobacteraceae bacterium]|nr:HNH endonuclease [Xanthobacteraceae bacterium]